jgi:hypothetical protein
MSADTHAMVMFLGVLAVGVGGAIASRALGDETLSMAILTFAAGLLVPSRKLLKMDSPDA